MKRLITLMICVPAMAQEHISYEEFERRVLDYSIDIKQSNEQLAAREFAVKVAKAAFMPSVDGVGNYQYRINNDDMELGGTSIPLKHNAYSVGISVEQPVYTGGALRNTYEAAEISTLIAEEQIIMTTDNIVHAAETSYWGTAAQMEIYNVMCDYVDIIGKLTTVLKDKYDAGYISKTDLLQMQTRLQEAELQRSNALLTYRQAMQGMNVLMGKEPAAATVISDSLTMSVNMPPSVSTEIAIDQHPEFSIALLNVAHQSKQVRIAASRFNPKLSVGLQQTWGTQSLNINGDTKFSCTLTANLKVPIFHWGERRNSIAVQRAALYEKELALQDKLDMISLEVANAMTSIRESQKQIGIAESNQRLAEENLDINTFSYIEGRLPILDVLSAQLTWLQARTGLIQSHYKLRIAIADYRKATGNALEKTGTTSQ